MDVPQSPLHDPVFTDPTGMLALVVPLRPGVLEGSDPIPVGNAAIGSRGEQDADDVLVVTSEVAKKHRL